MKWLKAHFINNKIRMCFHVICTVQLHSNIYIYQFWLLILRLSSVHCCHLLFLKAKLIFIFLYYVNISVNNRLWFSYHLKNIVAWDLMSWRVLCKYLVCFYYWKQFRIYQILKDYHHYQICSKIDIFHLHFIDNFFVKKTRINRMNLVLSYKNLNIKLNLLIVFLFQKNLFFWSNLMRKMSVAWNIWKHF